MLICRGGQLVSVMASCWDHRQPVMIDNVPDPGVVSSAGASMVSALHVHMHVGRGKMTYGTVRVFADERALKRGVRKKVHRRGPHRVVSWIKR